MNPDTVNVGDRLNLTDLRAGETWPVTVVHVDADGRCLVRRDDNGAHYHTHPGFLTVRGGR